MEEQLPRGGTIRIKKQIDQRAESETPFFHQPNHDISLPLAAGRNREDAVRRAGAFKITPVQKIGFSFGANPKPRADPIRKFIKTARSEERRVGEECRSRWS